jgi:hypothetical protein
MEFVISQIIGFLIGLFSSWLFWYTLILAKPHIVISPYAAYNQRKGSLLIKIMNKGTRQATDIQAQLSLVQLAPSGRFFTRHQAKLRLAELPALAPIKESDRPWGIRTAFVFATDEGELLIKLLTSQGNGEKRLVFTLAATDGLSGTKLVQQVAYRTEDIQYGHFGKWLEIVQDDKTLVINLPANQERRLKTELPTEQANLLRNLLLINLD